MQGEVEFRSILFVPATKKEDITDRKTKNIRLYVKRVFISDDFDGELVCLILSTHSSLFCKILLPGKSDVDHCVWPVPKIFELCEGCR
jgi:hypothetical protein